MEERRLGPVVGLGTWNTFGGDAALAARVVGAALDAGVRVFDSSPMYRGAEASLGVGARRPARSDDGRDEDLGRIRSTRAASSTRASVEWFGRVEIEQIHNLAAWRAQLEWLAAEREEGRIDKLGVTHYARARSASSRTALRTGRFDVVQLPYNPREREVERELLPLAAELGVAVIVMRPLGEGALVQRAPSERELAPLRAFGVETWAQALLKWVLSDERVDLVIPATSRPERAAENAAAGAPPWFGAGGARARGTARGMKPDESRTVYEGKLIDVALERWGGHEREIVEHPGAVAIVAIDRERQLWLVRQLREPARKALVELPAGTREPGRSRSRAHSASCARSAGSRAARGASSARSGRLPASATSAWSSSSPRAWRRASRPCGRRGGRSPPLARRRDPARLASSRTQRRSRGCALPRHE